MAETINANKNTGLLNKLKKHRYIYAVLAIVVAAIITQATTNGLTIIWNVVTMSIGNWTHMGKPYVDIIAVNQKYFGTEHTIYLLNSGNGTASNINFDIGLPNQSVKIISITGLSPSLTVNSPFTSSPLVPSLNYTQIGINKLSVGENASFDIVLNMPAEITINNAKINNIDNESCISYLEQNIVPINLTRSFGQFEYSFSNLGVCNITKKFAVTFIIGNITRNFNTTYPNVTPLNMTITFNGFKPDTNENIVMTLISLGNET